MKRSFFALLAVLFLTSCIDYTKPPRTYEKEGVTKEVFDEIVKFQYEGHHYIWFRSLNGGYAGWDGGIIHDPNCPCHKETLFI